MVNLVVGLHSRLTYLVRIIHLPKLLFADWPMVKADEHMARLDLHLSALGRS